MDTKYTGIREFCVAGVEDKDDERSIATAEAAIVLGELTRDLLRIFCDKATSDVMMNADKADDMVESSSAKISDMLDKKIEAGRLTDEEADYILFEFTQACRGVAAGFVFDFVSHAKESGDLVDLDEVSRPRPSLKRARQALNEEDDRQQAQKKGRNRRVYIKPTQRVKFSHPRQQRRGPKLKLKRSDERCITSDPVTGSLVVKVL